MFAVAFAVYQLYMSAAYINTNTHLHIYTFIVCSVTRKIAFRLCMYVYLYNSRKNPRNGLSSIWLVVIGNPVCLFDVAGRCSSNSNSVTFAHINTFLLYLLWLRHTHTNTYTLIQIHTDSITFSNFRSKNLLEQ